MPSITLDEAKIRAIVSDVIGRMGTNGSTAPAVAPQPIVRSMNGRGRYGVFDDPDSACAASVEAQTKLRQAGVGGRDKIVRIVKDLCAQNAESWARLELNETRIGRIDHKIEKLVGIPTVPGVEWLRPLGMSGDHGITMEEYTPFGVIGAITPVTHSIPTLACNVISMVAAGNTVVAHPHPRGARCAAESVRAFNQAIERELGISNIVTIVAEPSLESFAQLTKNEQVNLLCITGGPGVVEAAMKSGKRSVCAGPGNPPVLVDETADMDKAARDILEGAAYDNNLLCIGEKQIFVVDAVYSDFLRAFERAGVVKLNQSELDRLAGEAFTTSVDAGGCSHAVLNRDLVGADPSVLAERAGRSIPSSTELLFAETDANHPFVVEEQMMPIIPVVRVRDVDEGIEMARISEHGYKHSAMIHSLNVDHMSRMVRAMDCTLFVKNGPSMAGLGSGGEGYLSFSIATTTGEGVTTPDTFTRKRRCVMVDQLNMYG